MELIRGLHNLRARHRYATNGVEGTVLTIGAFDGLHLGHQAVLRHLVDKARAVALPATVVTLEPLPREYFAPLDAPPRLMSFREKFEGLRELGVDRLLLVRFDDTMRNTEAVEFIEAVFVAGLAARHIVVGDDLRFGRDGGGDFELLGGLGRKHGFDVEDTATLDLQAQRVSSTRIRQALSEGDFAAAQRLLGRPYSIVGKVVYGRQLGRTLGVPTANVQLHRLRTALAGVYAVQVRRAGGSQWLPGVANVGTRPTVDASIKAILEVHILDFDEDVYGQRIEVQFCKKLREEQKFASVEVLREQIYRDIETSRQYFAVTQG